MNAGSIEAEYNAINRRDNGWQSLYQEIRKQCEKEAAEKHFSINESIRSKNRSLNRYRDVNPYDHSRIILHRGNTDYINANLVQMERAGRKYILTQGPLYDTVGHFWTMIWEQNSKAILMLNKLIEKTHIKCHLYWPQKIGQEHILNLNEVGLSVEYLKCEQYTNYCKRIFKLTDTESDTSREIIQFHYTTWPDFGVPSSPVAFLQFLEKVRESGALDADVGPAVVHCSAGIGRSGTFCLVDICLVLVEKEGESKVSVQEVLFELRRYRMGLIQTSDQLYFSYQAIIEGIKLLKDSKFTDYEEVPQILSNDDEGNNEEFLIGLSEEIPPPLPPRSHSLQIPGVKKPLPTIPNSESFNDFTNANAAANGGTTTSLDLSKEAIKNFINNEMKKIENITTSNNSNNSNSNNLINTNSNSSNISNRPLPPLPPHKQNSLDKVDESEDDVEEEDASSDDNLEVEKESGAADDNNENNNADISLKEEISATIDDKKALTNGIGSATGMGSGDNGTKGNSEGFEGNELKKRRRLERQANIEKKVNEIKRKQREADDSDKTNKKRRSIIKYIAAGVVVGVLCVYAYSKIA